MKKTSIVYALLWSASIVSAADYAPEQDTWCITYLSTYLTPVSNQANSPALTRPAEEPGRQPIAPSLKPTFAANISTRRTQASFNTELPTSIILPQSSGAVGLSSDGPEFSTSGTEPIAVQSDTGTQPPDPLTEPVIDEVATSSLSIDLDSTVSTDAIPTSSGLVEAAGRSVIFQVSVTDNEKSGINRRQATGGFVGNENPQICTFAAIFNLAEGQLFEGDAPIYYSGESYKELSGQDLPASGSITKTFEDSGRLVFRNPGLPNGRAGFCQTPDGIVYVTFTNGPVGCIPVELVVYDVTQCQDGRLVGEDDVTATASRTVPQNTTTPGGIGPEVTSSIEDSTTMEINTRSEDSETQPGTIDPSSQTSAAGPSASSSSAIASISQSETSVIDGTASVPTDSARESVPEATTLATATTLSTDDVITSNTLDTDSETETEVETLTTNTDNTVLETTTSTVDITIADTTAASTTTGSDPPGPQCTDTNNPYIAPNGVTFTLSCNTVVGTIVLQSIGMSNFILCVQACSEIEACVASEFYKPAFLCYLFSEVFDGPANDSEDSDAAIKVPVITDTTTATTDASTTISDAPKPECTSTNNPYTASNGVTFTLYCNTVMNGFAPIAFFTAEDFIVCIQACSEIEACVGVEFNRLNSACVTVSQIIDGTSQGAGSSDVALKDPVLGDTTAAITDTMTADTTTADIPILDTTTTDALVADTTTSATPTEISDPSPCEDLGSHVTVDSTSYVLSCNTIFAFSAYDAFEVPSFLACIQACSVNFQCNVGIVFQKEISRCYIVAAIYSSDDPNPGYDTARIRGGA
ncbi:unnamed protein product [Fusarium venenatum]|uniref:DUF7908 domain-containing protein n=1 Tax=Fusarium venenatum TaxID=56646 RepID=A0A2L2SXX4_9HYPO|nr:uncharacterized protein FVRRES_13666 [Fusarium venenatum]CEI41627.1 unnamed protein product [Fusarium venenatum]